MFSVGAGKRYLGILSVNIFVHRKSIIHLNYKGVVAMQQHVPKNKQSR